MTQVMNIITGVFVENASVLFKPDDREAMYRAMLYKQETILQFIEIGFTIQRL